MQPVRRFGLPMANTLPMRSSKRRKETRKAMGRKELEVNRRETETRKAAGRKGETKRRKGNAERKKKEDSGRVESPTPSRKA